MLPLVNIFTCMLPCTLFKTIWSNVQKNVFSVHGSASYRSRWVQQSQDCRRTLVHWTIEICFKAVVQDECSWTITPLNPSRVLCRYDFSYWRLMHLLYVLNVDANKITNILYFYFTPYSAFVCFTSCSGYSLIWSCHLYLWRAVKLPLLSPLAIEQRGMFIVPHLCCVQQSERPRTFANWTIENNVRDIV